MSTDQTQPVIDESKVEAFVGRLVTDFAAAISLPLVLLGDRLGLYRAMTATGPVTAAQLAASTGTNQRLVTEWLGNQVAGSIVIYQPDAGTYELPMEHALALSVVDSPAYLMGGTEMIAAATAGVDRLEQAFRSDGGIDWDDQPGILHSGVDRWFRTAYVNQMNQAWFPAIEGLVERLQTGARVADVGAGYGQSSLIIGRTWPNATVVGIDSHDASIVAAEKRLAETGLTNVSFLTSSAADLPGGPYDVVLFFDAIHDMGDPLGALETAHAALTDDGIVMLVEPWSQDRLEDGIGNPLVRFAYAASTAFCLPTSLSQEVGFGMGANGGPSQWSELFEAAGFHSSRLAADTGHNLVLEARK